MIEFFELKERLIRDLSEHIDSLQTFESRDINFYTFTSKIQLSSIKELIAYVKDETVCYFKPPGGAEIMGLCELAYYNSIMDLQDIDSELKKNPELDFLGALPFDSYAGLENEWEEFRDHHIFLPKFVIEKKDGTTTFKVNFKSEILTNPLLKMNLLVELEDLFSFVHRGDNKFTQISEELTPNEVDWNNSVNKCLDEFSKDSLQKVVLARKKVITYFEELDAHKLLLSARNPSNVYEFFYHLKHGPSFISFTPEKLYKLEGSVLTIDAIAGTEANTDGSAEKLLNSQKDLEEHRLVSHFIEKSLVELGGRVTKLATEELLILPKLIHIQTKFAADFKDPVSNNRLLEALHPTPAVGGAPRQEALQFLQEIESINRGLYAGPVGRISLTESEFAVAIRSILVKNNELHFFGGAGIVKASEAQKEWKETADKIESIQCMM